MPEIGKTLTRKYRIIKLIDSGGMGSVYEAEHVELGKRVAIKFLHGDPERDEEGVERFKREARAAAATGHQSIVDVYDIDTTEDGELYLVMEYLQGETLGAKLNNSVKLETSLATYIVGQVLSALHAAHCQGIIHRDVKPDNIFLIDIGHPFPGVKLLDFGTARVVDPARPTDRLTQSGVIIGTPYYMAPEQAAGESDLDGRADLYSIGVILYECVTGVRPFNGKNLFELIHNILEKRVVPPREINPDISPALEELLIRALARDPEKRSANAATMLRSLLPLIDERARMLIPLPEEVAYLPDTIVVEGKTPNGVSSFDENSRKSQIASNQKPRFSLWVLLACVVVCGLVAIGLLWKTGGEDRSRSDVALVVTTVTGDAAIAESGAALRVVNESDAHQAKEHITITLIGIPEDSKIFVDGQPTDGPVLRLERGDGTRLLLVKSGEKTAWSHAVSLSQDQQIEVELEAGPVPLSQRSPPPSQAGRAHRPTKHRNKNSLVRPLQRPATNGEVEQQQPFDTHFRL